MDSESITKTLEELQLIQYSLLPDEHMLFLDDSAKWRDALNSYSDDDPSSPFDSPLSDMPSVCISLDGSNIRFELNLGEYGTGRHISIKGENITRKDQERWEHIILEKTQEISDSEYPNYQLLSLHLLPMLHKELEAQTSCKSDLTDGDSAPSNKAESELFHILFVSHHLLSVNKRRSLQHWSSSLRLNGFAKVGYPGVIYAQGERQNIEEFLSNVKAMQWLALKVRFVEPLPVIENGATASTSTSWKEFQKVGEVVDEMRRLGREEYVVEMGIGSSTNNK